MNILLINSNPVVSRLISLCMREDNIVFEEVESVGNVLLDRYAFVFVDDASYVDETKDILSNLIIRKKVFLSSRDESEDTLNFFDTIVKKPFLPSQIRTVLKSMDERESVEVTEEAPSIFPLVSEDACVEESDEIAQKNSSENAEVITVTEVLDSNEIEKIKELLEMDEAEEESSEDCEARKVEAIKQQLEADGLEIVSEEEYVEELSKKPKSPKNKKIKKEKKKSSEFTKKELKSIKNAMQISINKLKSKKIKKLLKGKKVKIKVKLEDTE